MSNDEKKSQTAEEMAEYIAELTLELAEISARFHMRDLEYFLELASAEAESIARHSESEPQESTALH